MTSKRDAAKTYIVGRMYVQGWHEACGLARRIGRKEVELILLIDGKISLIKQVIDRPEDGGL